MVKSFSDIMAKVKECSPKTVAVAVAQDDACSCGWCSSPR